MCSKYGIHALPVVGKGDDERDIVLGIVTDVEVGPSPAFSMHPFLRTKPD
jgi:hypothetical protein